MPRAPRKTALLIGNGRFNDPELSALTAPFADVKALREVLRDRSIGGFDDVEVLNDADFADAYAAIGNLFRVESGDDTILLYYSGHGLPDERGHLYLATRDTSAANPDGNSIPAAEIRRMMGSSRSRRQVLVLDCCYSGAFGTAKDQAPLAINAHTFTTEGFGQHVLTASRSVERAYEGNQEIDGVETSLFTHFLIRGLETGEAARAGEEQITVGDLYKYVHRGVVSHTDKMQPQMWVDEGQGELVIARNPKPHKVPDELNEMLESDNWYVREGAVRILGRWLRTSDSEKRDLATRTLRSQNDRERDRSVADAITEELQRANATNESTTSNESAPTNGEAVANELIATIKADRTARMMARWQLIAGLAFVLAIGALAAAVYLEYRLTQVRSHAATAIDEVQEEYGEQTARVNMLTVELADLRAELGRALDERNKARESLKAAHDEIDRFRKTLNRLGGSMDIPF